MRRLKRVGDKLLKRGVKAMGSAKVGKVGVRKTVVDTAVVVGPSTTKSIKRGQVTGADI